MRYYHTCPYCEAEITVAAAQVGKRAECSECGAGFTVPTKVRENPAPEPEARPARKHRSRREDPDAARRAGMMLGLLIGLLGLLATGVVVACLFTFTNLFTKDRDADTAQVDQTEPESKPQTKPDPKTRPEEKPQPKPEPKVTPTPPAEPAVPAVSDPPKSDPMPNPFRPPVGKFPPDIEPEPDFPPPRPPGPGGVPLPPVFNPPPFDPPPPVFNPPPPRPDRPAADPPRGNLTFPAAAPVELKPAPLNDNTTEVKLPDKIADAVVGGGGRYWCLLLPDAKQVAVFDTNQAKVAKYIPLASGKACIAAGMNKLLVVYPDTEVIVRYDLGTFEKEVTAKLPFRGTVKQTCLGSASAGPMLVFYGKGTGALDSAPVTFLDITTLKELDAGGQDGRGGRALTASFRDAMHYRASPDGKVYGAWATSHSPTGLNGIVLSEAGVKSYYEHDSVGGVVPAGDGKLLTGAGIFTPELKAVGKKEWSAGQRIPAQQGDWYLSVAPAKANDFGIPDRNQSVAGKTTIYRTTDTRPILSLGDVGMTVGNDAWTGVDFTQDKRVLFSPVGGLIAWVAPTNDKIHLYKFNLDAELEKSGVDYLFVTSRPPVAEPGKAYAYKLAVKSKQGTPTFKLDAGPAGMKVAADGTLTWAVPKDYAGDESVILTVSDKSGQEVFHTFTLAKGTPQPAVPAPVGGGGPVVVKPPEPEPEQKIDLEPRPDPVPPRPGPVPPRADPDRAGLVRPAANPAKITPTKAADKAEIKLPGAADQSCLGGGGRYVLFRIPKVKQIAVLDVSEGKVVRYLPLAEEGALIAAGNEHLFVIAPTANVIQRWSLTTFAKEATVPNPLGSGPKQALMGHATDGPLFLAGPGKDGVGLLDPKTFKKLELPAGANWGRMMWWDSHPPAIRVSADGRVFGHWCPGLSPSGLRSLVLGSDSAKAYDEHTSAGAILPGPDGTLFTNGGLYTPELKSIGKNLGGQPIPAAHGRLYLTASGPDRFDQTKKDTKLTLRMLGDDRPLVELGDLAGLELPADPWARGGVPVYDRLFLVPDAKAMAVLHGTADKVTIHKVDVESLMEKAGIDYLFVVSRPPGAVPGAAFSYKPEVKSKQGGVKVKLDAGPAGMKVAADGTLTWAVPKDYAGDESVILTVSDKSGQEVFHTFTLAKGTPQPPVPAPGVKPPSPAPEPEPVPAPKVQPDPVPAPPAVPRAEPKQGPVRPAVNPAKITPTKAADKAEIKLPGAADLTCLGGGGRYVLFRIPKVKQIAILDVCEGKIAKFLPLAEEGALIAAGNEHLFVLAPTANVIQRWNLKTFEKESTVPNPLTGTPRGLLVGHATDGPVFVVGPNKPLDGKTFKAVEFNRGANGRDMAGHPQYAPNVRVSADGRVFAWWTQGLSPSGLSSMVVGGDEAKSYSQHTTVGAINPGPDGTLFTAGGVYTPELKRVGGNAGYQYWYHAPIPAAHGNLYLDIPPNNLPGDRGGAKMFVKMLGETKPLGEVTQLAGLDIPKDHNQTGARGLQLHDRVFLVPDAKTLAVLNGAADKIIIHKFDVESLMEKAGIDYLFVVSRPPGAVPGAAFSYKPEVKSKQGGVKVKLDAGPAGMKVAADGTLTWAVPKDYAGDESVILTVSDKSGKEVFHTFTLPVGGTRP